MIGLQLAAVLLAVSGVGDTVLIDFRADYCGPCRAMDSTIEQLAARGYPVKRVNVDQNPALAQQFHVSSIPCFVLVVDGHEVERFVGGRDIGTFEAMFQRAGVGPNAVRPTSARAPAASPAAQAIPVTFSQGSPGEVTNTSANSAANSAGRGAAALDSAPQNQALAAQLIAATVRLKIEDREGNSIGTGTIIDARDGQALVLTCGHVFRDSAGKGKIFADTFGPSGARHVEGRMLDYDLKSDVGLVVIPVSGSVAVAHVAPSQVRRGERVISVGCNHGDDPTARESSVTSLDKFLGSPNLQVAGQPVQGRSGGGLFNLDGQIIGVCNAADPSDNEGLYAALGAIQNELDRSKLGFVYKADNRVATDGPAADRSLVPVSLAPTSERREPRAETPARLTASEQATLAELRDKAQGAEIICIVRPLANSQAKSEVIVLDRASPAFMQQIGAGQGSSDGRQLTAFDAPANRDATVRR